MLFIEIYAFAKKKQPQQPLAGVLRLPSKVCLPCTSSGATLTPITFIQNETCWVRLVRWFVYIGTSWVVIVEPNVCIFISFSSRQDSPPQLTKQPLTDSFLEHPKLLLLVSFLENIVVYRIQLVQKRSYVIEIFELFDFIVLYCYESTLMNVFKYIERCNVKYI